MSVTIDIAVVEGLPYSCLVGTDVLEKFEQWLVDNVSSTLKLNSTSVPVYAQPQFVHSINLITSSKTSLLPGESKIIKTIGNGPGTSAIRPFTCTNIVSEGFEERENRSGIQIFPSLNLIGNNNNNEVYIQATNTSNQVRGPPRGVREVVKAVFLFVKIVNLKNKVREIVKTMSFMIREKRKNPS